MPCKHLFAVMREYQEKTWESLPASFRESPHITLDQEAATFLQEANHQLPEPALDQCDSLDQDHGSNLQELPRRVVPSSLKQVALRCRERLALLRDMTYTCHDPSLLAAVEEKLGDLVGLLNQDGVLTELTPPPTTSTIKGPVKRKPAALRRRKKAKTSGRVGIAAERAKVASKITIQENGDVDKATLKRKAFFLFSYMKKIQVLFFNSKM